MAITIPTTAHMKLATTKNSNSTEQQPLSIKFDFWEGKIVEKYSPWIPFHNNGGKWAELEGGGPPSAK